MQFNLNCKTVICQNCGFCFVSPPPTQEAYQRFYRDGYSRFYRKIHPEKTGQAIENDRDRGRFEEIEKSQRIRGADILEIGAGRGRFLELAARRGANCFAVEPSSEFRRHLASKGISTIGDFVENLGTDRKFDLICFFQVLEHIEDPRGMISVLAKLLRPDGLLVFDVPNIWKPFRNLDRYFLRYVHLSYFSPRTLCRLLNGQGFEIIHLDEGGPRSLRPQPIFAIAKERESDQKVSTAEGDDPEKLAAFLRSYRRRYPVFIAPRLYFLQVRKASKGFVSRSIIGATYRSIRGRN